MMMKGTYLWHIAVLVAQRLAPGLLAAVIGLLLDAALLDAELAEALLRVLQG